jgi:hypothetical protein
MELSVQAVYRSALVASLCLAGATFPDSSAAVSLSASGEGQVLIFPYYTVNKGLNTLVSIQNTRAEPKALRVRFREHRNGRSVLEFNLYLAAHDTWTAAVFSGGPDGSPLANAPAARLATGDQSCTVPRIPPQGQDFLTWEYLPGPGRADDGGPYEPSRTREGFVEVIEMGRLVDVEGFRPASAASSSSGSAIPANCAVLERAWLPFGPIGVWEDDAPGAAIGSAASRGVASPNGGLRGSMILVDPAQGISFSVAPTVLDGFFEAAPGCAPDCLSMPGENLHSDPGNTQHPTLANARDAEGDASALVVSGNAVYRFRFEGPHAGLKATSAALMRTELSNEYYVREDGTFRADSEWVVTLPTRHLHLALAEPRDRLPFTEPYVGGNAQQSPPYGTLTSSVAGCERTSARLFSRDGRTTPPSTLFPVPLPQPTQRVLDRSVCSSVRVFSFGGRGAVDVLQGGQNALSPVLGAFAHQGVELPAGFSSEGWMRLGMTVLTRSSAGFQSNVLFSSPTPDPANPGRANAIFGLPAIGFWASNVFTAWGGDSEGVLANYAIFSPHGGERAAAAVNVVIGADGSVSWQPAEP